jgi:hypothetical protein
MSMGMGRRTGPLDLMRVVEKQEGGGLLLRTSGGVADA